ncbi:hypothetical protein [Corallococcus aberystwythensis]|uniref:Uncharacterized protein n=1 Tax=Corallococcus aberystwythensis TaxID=2316722 RepID=A0A3A8QK84_9BACT|nr:hypothetical protein [Corallococcus aberystwythensis]RKH67340.1 hypothetical protein D7W81_13945 [Corallococcus aberystwythensis]
MARKKWVSRILMLGSLTLLAGCGREPRPPEVIQSPGPANVALLIEREDGAGPYVESTAERFRVVASGEAIKSVRWSANAGVVEPSDEHVTWTLPSAGTASLSVTVETESGKTAEGAFQFNVVAAPLASSSAIDTGPDVTGSSCDIAFDSTGKGHVIYTNDTHNSLWYASWDGTAWTTELIDGPGFNNGGVFVVKSQLAIDPVTGTPHVAYSKGTGNITNSPMRAGYATRVNGAWVREEVDASVVTRISIALNPAQAQRPSIVFSSGNAGSVEIATRTASNTWSSVPFSVTAQALTSDALFDATGALHFITHQPSNGYVSQSLQVLRGSAVESFPLKTSATGPWLAAAWAPGSHFLALSNAISDGEWNAIEDITVGTPAASSTRRVSTVDYKYAASDLAYGGGKPVVALRNGTALALGTTDAQGFWTYTQLGTVQDASRPSVAIRPTDGVPHVCYQRDGKVTFQ